MHSLVFLEYYFGKLSRVLVNAVSGYILVELEVCKSLEDLLKRSLTDGIVLKLVLFLEFFNKLEQEPDGLVMTFDSQAHVTSVVFNNFDAHELVAKTFDHSE